MEKQGMIVNDMSVWEDCPTIPEFYRGKVIFMTGFTGFVGKLLAEKLLRSCPDLKVIYILVRSKRGKSMKERIKQVTDLPIYDRLREIGGPFLDKLVGLEGDTSLPDLGLSEVDRAALMKVNVIIHAAASVRFDDPLHQAMNINTLSVKRILNLAVQMENLESFVYISTAYVNCHLKGGVEIEEKLYPMALDWRQAIKDSEKIDPRIFSTLSYKYMNDMPNTYVFSKRIAEHIVAHYSDRIPSAIIRPTIVVAPSEEPLPGWIDNMNGPVGLMIGHASGVIRTSLVDLNVKPDFMPVDLTNRYILILPWMIAHRKNPKSLEVFNAGSNDVSCSFKELSEAGRRLMDEYPMKDAIWVPSVHYCTSKFWFTLNSFLFQLIPGMLIDGILKLAGKKPMLWMIQLRVYVAIMNLSYFTMNFFNFVNENMIKVNASLKKQDVKDFYFFKDIISAEWFLRQTVPVGYKVMFKQKEEDIAWAQKRMKVFHVADKTIKTLFWGTIAWKIYTYNILYDVPKLILNSIIYLITGQNLF